MNKGLSTSDYRAAQTLIHKYVHLFVHGQHDLQEANLPAYAIYMKTALVVCEEVGAGGAVEKGRDHRGLPKCICSTSIFGLEAGRQFGMVVDYRIIEQ